MSVARHRLSRPVYEGLPWTYLLGGVAALIASYFQTSATLSLVLGLPGLLALLAGTVVLLRRRGYRRLRAQYGAPEALDEATAGMVPTAMPAAHAAPDAPESNDRD
jgi:UDP-N-acetylmuramyl pentapeptide phosphotransferase/UDP-N-acetylglucosamine-1-phosphate transferase